MDGMGYPIICIVLVSTARSLSPTESLSGNIIDEDVRPTIGKKLFQINIFFYISYANKYRFDATMIRKCLPS